MDATTKITTTTKKGGVRSVKEYGLEDAVSDCREQVLIRLLVTLMNKVTQQGLDIQRLKRIPVSTGIRKKHIIPLPPKLRNKKKRCLCL